MPNPKMDLTEALKGLGFRTSPEALSAFVTHATKNRLSRPDTLPAFERRLRHYTKPSLLIIDELGYIPADARGGDILYNIISRRHQESATIISTNLAFKQWGTIFPGAACVAALVDRFTENCHVMHIEGESWRQKNGGAES